MQENLGFGESVEVTIVRAQPEIVNVLKEVVQKNWLLILIVIIIIYFIWKSKNKKKEAKQWVF